MSPDPGCPVDGRTDPPFGLAALGSVAAASGFAFCAVGASLVRLAAVLLAAVRGLVAVPAGLAVLPDFAALLADLPVLLVLAAPPAGLAADLDLEAGLGEAAGLGTVLTCDMVLAASVSDLAAVVMALVAVFIACMAVDIVLAEDVALVAAAVILVAAEVTFVAADETVRAAAAVDGALDAAGLAPLLLLLPLVVLAVLVGLLAERAGVLLLVDLARSPAGLRRAVVRVVVRAGTDLPPSRSITEVLFHEQRRFTHPMPSYLQNNGRKQTKIAANSPPDAAGPT